MAKRTTKTGPAATEAIPAIEQLARAFSYITIEFRIRDGLITGEMWAEGLAFGGRCQIDSTDLFQARAMRPQLSAAQWAEISARAAFLASEAC